MTPTQLYRHFDASGRLLYVGISNDARQRLQQHLKCCDWRARFSSMTVEEHPTRGSAVDAEARAILEEHPIYNRAGRRKQPPIPSFGYRDLKGKGATDMWRDGVQIEKIQALLGHASKTTTEIYVKQRWVESVEANQVVMK